MTEGIDPRIADALLDRLTADDGFRERFAASPDTALRELGYNGELRIGPCCKLPLPPKSVFQEARDTLRLQLTSKLSLEIFKL